MAINIPTFEPVKTPLTRVSEETLEEVMNAPHGMVEYLRLNFPDHILVSGKRYNQTGVILYGFEHLGRTTNCSELAAQLGLAEKQVINAVSKMNAIISPVFGFKIERAKAPDGSYTGMIRLTTQDDALQASEAYCKKLKKMHTEYVQTMRSYRNNGGNIAWLLGQVDNGGALVEMVQELAPALAPAQPQATEA